MGHSFMYIWFQTKSLFIASLGMMHIFLSFFMTYAIYKQCTDWYPFLLWLGLFVICGIGADDIFVMVDAWKQSFIMLPPSTPLENRISWAHSRASSAMLVTSFTTAAAFLSNTVNYVIPVALFGAFMALLVMINYVMVCTMFPSVIVLHYTWFELPLLAHGQQSSVWRIALDKMLKLIGQDSLLRSQTLSDGANGVKLRPVERWFQDRFAPFVWATKARVCTGFGLLTVFVFFVYTIRIDKATEAVNLWPHNFAMEVYSRAMDGPTSQWPSTYATDFSCEPDCEHVLFVFGAIAHDDGSVFDSSDYGRPKFDPDFDLLSPESQLWLSQFMERARKLSVFAPKGAENLPQPTAEEIANGFEKGKQDTFGRLLGMNALDLARTTFLPSTHEPLAFAPFAGGCGLFPLGTDVSDMCP
eukprot:COSAG05_NODE_2406_length_3102_cov_1.630703_1_plen_413_part_10